MPSDSPPRPYLACPDTQKWCQEGCGTEICRIWADRELERRAKLEIEIERRAKLEIHPTIVVDAKTRQEQGWPAPDAEQRFRDAMDRSKETVDAIRSEGGAGQYTPHSEIDAKATFAAYTICILSRDDSGRLPEKRENCIQGVDAWERANSVFDLYAGTNWCDYVGLYGLTKKGNTWCRIKEEH